MTRSSAPSPLGPARFRVRLGRARDRAFVAALATEALGEYDPAAGRRVQAMTHAPDTFTLIALRASRPVGFAVLGAGSGPAELLAIAVQPSARGNGAGRLLLTRAEARARLVGARVLRLCTAEANVAATELFLKAGFIREQRFVRYYQNGQNAVSMVKALR